MAAGPPSETGSSNTTSPPFPEEANTDGPSMTVTRKTWTGPEIAYLRHVCFEHEDLRSLIAQRKWRRAAERLAPLLRDEFYAEPFAAESPADFVARYTSQHRSGHARKSLKRRTRRETQAEYAARLTRLPADLTRWLRNNYT